MPPARTYSEAAFREISKIQMFEKKSDARGEGVMPAKSKAAP